MYSGRTQQFFSSEDLAGRKGPGRRWRGKPPRTGSPTGPLTAWGRGSPLPGASGVRAPHPGGLPLCRALGAAAERGGGTGRARLWSGAPAAPHENN